jgi:hypothetical protein
VDPADPRLQQRPLIGMAILALPLVILVLTVAAYAVTVGFGLRGRTATGPPVTLAFSGCAEAGSVLSARLADMGLSVTPVDGDPLAFQVVLPPDPEVAAAVPQTLSMPGLLEVRGGDEALAGPEDVVDASVRMDLLMIPSTLLHLSEPAAERVKDYVRADPDARMTFTVDGVTIGTQWNQLSTEIGEVEIDPIGADGQRLDDGKARWAAVAAWSVVVDHPLPCAITPR